MHELNKQNSLATLETIEEVISAFKSIDDLHRALALGYIQGIMQDIACLVRRIKS